MIRFSLTILLSILFAHLHAQDSIYLALAPHWTKTYWFGSKGEHSVSLTKDKNDNVYMATYHKLYGERLDTALFARKANTNESLSMAVIKHNTQGKILWANSVVSNESMYEARSEATAIAIDSKGNVVVVGTISGKGLFTSTDTTSEIKLLLEKKEHSFVAKYTPTGKLLSVKTFLAGEVDELTRNIIRSIAIDKNDNVWFCGTRLIPVRQGSSIDFDPAILIGKLDASGKLLFEQTFNSKGRDTGVQGVLDSKDNFYLGAVFNKPIKVGTDSLRQFRNANNSFVAKFDPAGSVIWTLSPQPLGVASLGALAIDKQDKLYMAGEFWDTLRVASSREYLVTKKTNVFVAGFTSKGQLSWLKQSTEEWYPSSYDRLKQLRVGDDGMLYVSGGALGMKVKTTNGTHTFQYLTGEQYMGNEAFIIQYDLSGNAQWLRIVSGKGDQVITDFVVNKSSDVTVTGNFSRHLEFKNKSLENGATVFYAQALASTVSRTAPDKGMLAQQQEATRRESISMTDCSCEEYPEKLPGVRNSIPLNTLLSDDNDRGLLTALKTDPVFSHLFAFDLQANDGYYDFKLVAYKPIRIKLSPFTKDNTVDPSALILDLTPCAFPQEKFLFVDAGFHATYPLKELDYYDEFTGTGPEYFNLMLGKYESGIEGVLGNFTDSFEDEFTDEELQPFLAYLNKKFKLTIKTVRESNLSTQLEATGKNIDLTAEVYTFYLKPHEGADHKPTKAFDEKMRQLFRVRDSQGIEYESAESFKKNYVDPQYTGTAAVKRFKLEFPKALVNSTNPWAMFRGREFEWSSQSGLSVDYKYLDQFCMQPFLIGTTGINITIRSKLFPDLSAMDNPLMNRHVYEHPVGPYARYQRLDQLESTFTGVFTREFDVTFPLSNKPIALKGYDLLISGQEITGWVEVKYSADYTFDQVVKQLQRLKLDLTVKDRRHNADGIPVYRNATKDAPVKALKDGETGLVFFRYRK